MQLSPRCSGWVAALAVMVAGTSWVCSVSAYDLDPRIGLLNTKTGCCTATIVGRADRIVTAGHCVANVGDVGTFYAAMSGGVPTFITSAKVIAKGTSPGEGDAQNDWAVLELENPLGNSLGFYPYSLAADWNKYRFILSGWPECGYTKTYESIRVTLDRSKDDKFEVFGIRSKGGMSGGPLLFDILGRRHFVGNYAQDMYGKPGRNPHFGAWVGKYASYLAGEVSPPPVPIPDQGSGPRGVLVCVHDNGVNCLLIDHNCPDLRRHLGHDFGDKISSLYLRGVRGVTLFEDDNYRGDYLQLTHDCVDLQRHNGHRFGDRASSLRIEW